MGPENLNNLYGTRLVARLPSSAGPGLDIPQANMFEYLFDHLFIFYETDNSIRPVVWKNQNVFPLLVPRQWLIKSYKIQRISI